MEKDSHGFLVDMAFRGEVPVENESELVIVWGGRQNGVIDGEEEVASSFSEGLWTNDDHV